MQAMTDEAVDLLAPLSIVPACVVNDHGGFPFDLRHEFERQATFRDVSGVFDGIEREPHLIYRYS